MSISWDDHDHKELAIVKDSLSSRYQLLAYLGGGGFGKVFKLKDKKLGRECALKVLNIDKLNETSDEGRKDKKNRFIKEARAYARCPHLNIVPIFDIDGEDTFPYFTMKYIEGKSLKDVIAEKDKLSFTEVLKISEGVLSALEYIHRQYLVHRDIKPANIMIEKESGQSIIIDFGIAKDLNSRFTLSGTIMGSPFYMAPEQFRDSSKATLKSDIYSFGVVLYEMLAGEVPFNGEKNDEIMYNHMYKPVPNIRKKNPELPKGIEDIICKAMKKEPIDRYESAGQFLDAIRQIQETPKNNNGKNEKPVGSPVTQAPKKEEDGNKTIKPEKRSGPYRKSKYKYLVYIIGIIVAAIATFIFFKSAVPRWQYDGYISSAKTFIQSNDLEKANEALNNAKKIKDTNEIESLLTEIAGKRTEGMKRDFDDLKALLKGRSSNNGKLQSCREFLVKHEGVPANNEKTAIFSEINNSISNLERSVQLDEEYQNLLSTAREYVKKGDYPKAVDILGRATNNRGGITSEIAALSNEIREKQIEAINGEQYQNYIHTVNNLIKSEDYEGAKRELDKARKINDTDEVKRLSTTIAQGLENERKNGDKEYRVIRDKINLSQYQAFWKNYPSSIYLRDLKKRLKTIDKNLPPETYWDRSISKNSKGYYELTFGSELNGHRMIYIPEKKIWIDKYEVSWAQFRKYLRDEKRSIPSTVSNEYINNGDGFPSVVTFEEAERYCRKYSFRLPKMGEWEYVAGKGSLTFPWGNESPDIPYAKLHWRANLDTLEGDKDKDGYKGTAPVKSFESFSSPFGVVNMAGNVWEWIQGKALKGGGYLSLPDDLRIRNVRQAEPLDKEGFRCIKAED